MTEVALNAPTITTFVIYLPAMLGNGWLINAGVRYIDIDTTGPRRAQRVRSGSDVAPPDGIPPHSHGARAVLVRRAL